MFGTTTGDASMNIRDSLLAALIAFNVFAIGTTEGAATETKDQITILYDAFGTNDAMTKDWGFSALVEVAGKRILFDTGNDPEIFAET
jgi:7,8-dihydropterin-6-yl-methyl-4-(beta-D-ribofuranosyl)aminobenzene 5'-phosphate synthase